MFKSFTCECDRDTPFISDILSAAKANMLACSEGSSEQSSFDLIKDFIKRSEESHSKVFSEFNCWVDKLVENDPN